jgi:hypothetical protein
LFCSCGARRAVDGAFQVDAFGRGRCSRRGNFSGPPLLEASLHVNRNTAHNQSSAFVVAPVSRPQLAWSLKGPLQSALSLKVTERRNGPRGEAPVHGSPRSEPALRAILDSANGYLTPSKILEQSTKQKTRPMEIKGRGSLVALTAQGICAVTRIVELGGLAKTKIQPKRPQDASAVGRHAAIGIDRFLHSRQKPDSPAVFLESRRGRRFTRGAPYLGGCKSP